MDKIEFNEIIIDDSLNSHGGVGIDFWKNNTLIATLNIKEAQQLAKWLLKYLSTYSEP